MASLLLKSKGFGSIKNGRLSKTRQRLKKTFVATFLPGSHGCYRVELRGIDGFSSMRIVGIFFPIFIANNKGLRRLEGKLSKYKNIK